MGCDDHLIAVAPHPPRGDHSDLVCFFGCDLAFTKTLVAVVGDDLAALAETLFDRGHFLIGACLGAVDTGHIHSLFGFAVINSVFQSGIQIGIYIPAVDRLIGIARVVDDLFQPVSDEPESGGSRVASHSSHIICRRIGKWIIAPWVLLFPTKQASWGPRYITQILMRF